MRCKVCIDMGYIFPPWHYAYAYAYEWTLSRTWCRLGDGKRLRRRNFVYWGCGYIGGRVWTWFGYLQRFDSNGERGPGQ